MELSKINKANELLDRIKDLNILRKLFENGINKPFTVKTIVKLFDTTKIESEQQQISEEKIHYEDNKFIMEKIDEQLIKLEKELNDL